jgi:hypothetical protein
MVLLLYFAGCARASSLSCAGTVNDRSLSSGSVSSAVLAALLDIFMPRCSGLLLQEWVAFTSSSAAAARPTLLVWSVQYSKA